MKKLTDEGVEKDIAKIYKHPQFGKIPKNPDAAYYDVAIIGKNPFIKTIYVTVFMAEIQFGISWTRSVVPNHCSVKH
jgi:hypothetical protein